MDSAQAVSHHEEKKMKTARTVLMAVTAGVALAATAPAFADDWEHERGYGHWHHHEEGRAYYGQPQVEYAPAPVYYDYPGSEGRQESR